MYNYLNIFFFYLVNPYFNLLSDSRIFAPVASSPIIRIVIAINSDGTIAQQRMTTDSLIFTHTRDDITTSVEGLEPDSLIIQLYKYTFPPLRRGSQGDYRIRSCTYVCMYTMFCIILFVCFAAIVIDGTQPLDVTIRVDVNITGKTVMSLYN